MKDNWNIATSLKKAVEDPEEADANEQLIEDFSSVAGLVQSRYHIAKLARQQEQEQIWLASYRAWRGILSPDEQAAVSKAQQRSGAASSVFIKITKTKTTAAFGQLCEILFSNNKFPLGVKPTPKPEGIDETVTIVPEGVQYGEDTQDTYGYAGDGREIPAGANTQTLLSNLKSSVSNLIQGKKLVPGHSPDGQMPSLSPAQIGAQNLEKEIQDQLSECKGEKVLRKTAYECVLYGTGFIKGPFSYKDMRPFWEEDENGEMQYAPKQKLRPKIKNVSVWDFYPDPDATSLEDAEYATERHLLSRGELRNLQNRPGFNVEAIERLLHTSPIYPSEYWETEVGRTTVTVPRNRYEVLEYWGSMDKELLQTLGEDVPDGALNSVQVNVWVCGGEILRVILNPFQPQALPYHVVPYEEHPHRIWGIGVPENMADTQMLMNGHLRMSIDNLRFAGSLVFEVNETQLVPGQSMEIYPGKVFRKQGGAPGQSVYGLSFPNTAEAHLRFFDKARMLADEATGLPSYAHGQTGTQSGVRSASQTSMLMSAAALNIKTVAKNFDDLITSVGTAMFYWNMQYNTEAKDIRGDYQIVAKGTAALMQREVVTQRLLALIQMSANPAIAPFLKIDEIIKEIVRNMDLDGEKFVNDPVTAKLFAEAMAPTMPSTVNQGGSTGQGNSPTGGNPSPTGDSTGNTPAPSAPQEQQFSGGGGASNTGLSL